MGLHGSNNMVANIREKNRTAGNFDDDGAGIITSGFYRIVLITNRITHELNSFDQSGGFVRCHFGTTAEFPPRVRSGWGRFRDRFLGSDPTGTEQVEKVLFIGCHLFRGRLRHGLRLVRKSLGAWS
jgi:hypothetical protein